MKNITKKYGVRRFARAGVRPDCFEVYNLATGECASLPGKRKEIEYYSKERNAEAAAQADGNGQEK